MSNSYSDKNFSLDVEQEKIIKLNENILITGGAGTGKTTALVKKIEYLIKKCEVQKNQICVLTHSQKAREQILSELDSYVDPENPEDSLWVSTIDKLAREVFEKTHGSLVTSNDMIYKVASDYLYENYDGVSSNKAFSNLIDEEADGTVTSEEYKRFKKLLHIRDYRNKQQSQLITLKGEKVKSRAECLIADFLFLNGIGYVYEKPLKINDERILQPDFTIEANGNEFILEYFGVKNNTEYEQNTEKKKKAYSTLGFIKLLSLEQTPIAELQDKLIELLDKNGIQGGDIDISSEARKRKQLLPLTKLIVDCLSDYISMYTDEREIKKLGLANEGDNKEFISLLHQVYLKYQMVKLFNNQIEFKDLNDVIKDATSLLDIPNYENKYLDEFKFKWLFIDEFQEANNLRLEFIKQIIKLSNPHLILAKDNLQDTLCTLQRSQDVEDEIVQKIGKSNRYTFNNHHRCRNEVYNVARSFIKDRSEYEINGKKSIFICSYNKENLYECIQKILKKEYNESQKENFSAEIVGIEERDLESLDVDQRNSLVKNWKVTCCEINKIKGTSCDTLCLMDSDISKHVEEEQYRNIVLPITDEDNSRRIRRLIYVALTRSRNNVYVFLEEGIHSDLVDELVKYKNIVSLYDFSGQKKEKPEEANNGTSTKKLAEEDIEAEANDDSRWEETEYVRSFEVYKEIIDAYKSLYDSINYSLGQEKLVAFLIGDDSKVSKMQEPEPIMTNEYYGYLSDYDYDAIKQEIVDMLSEGYLRIKQLRFYSLIEINEKQCKELEDKCLLFRELKILRRKIILRNDWVQKLGMWDDQLLDIVECLPKTKEEFRNKVRASQNWHNKYGQEFFNALENFRKTMGRKNLKKTI